MTTIAIGALGGTIAMTPDVAGGAVKPSLNAHDLVAAVPELADIATITAETLASVASPNLVMADLLTAYEFCLAQARAGVDGIVLTHGTDTLEETAYLLDLLWDEDIPLVITGAMRSPNLPSADGPGNILAATVAAASAQLKGMGVLVVLNDEVHLARTVAKTNSTATWTFASPGWGPVARIAERHASVMLVPRTRPEALTAPGKEEIRIPIIECALSDDGWAIDALAAASPRGIVLAASGVGHISVPARDAACRALSAGIPIVFASRTGSGRTLTASYGYPGSESDLLEHGFIGAGFLSPRKARLLLHVLTAAGADRETIASEFAKRGQI